MSTPRNKPPPLDRDRFEELHEKVGRGLDDSLAVQGSDEEDGPSPGSDDETLAALDAENGDPMSDDDNDEGEEIPLPAETLARGSRRP